METRELKETYNNLEVNMESRFNTLAKETGEYDFVDTHTSVDVNSDDISNELSETDLWDSLPTLEVRNSYNGNMYSIHVMKVSENGLYGANEDNKDDQRWYRFSDIATTYDKLSLLSEME